MLICFVYEAEQQTKLDISYLLTPKLLLRSQIVDGRTSPGPVNPTTRSDFPSVKSYVGWSPSPLSSTPEIHQTRSMKQGSQTPIHFFYKELLTQYSVAWDIIDMYI